MYIQVTKKNKSLQENPKILIEEYTSTPNDSGHSLKKSKLIHSLQDN